MINPPIEEILSWPTPNYVDPETRGPVLAAINHTFLALCVVLVAARIYTRLRIVRWFGWDDVLIIVALILSIGVNIGTEIGSSQYGWGRHVWDIPIEWATPSLKTAYATRLLFNVASNATMMSLLIFYYRLVDQAHIQWFRYLLWAAIAFNLVTWFVFFMSQVLICIPVHLAWALIKPEGARCLDEGIWTMVGGSFKTFVDLLVTTLPIPLILRMNMTRAQRYGLVFLLGLGYVVTAAGALRTYYSWRVYYGDSYDYTWEQFPAFVASAVENNLAVICACIPTLRPLFSPIFGPSISFIRSKVYGLTRPGTRSGGSGLSTGEQSKQFSSLKPGYSDPAAASERRLVIEKRESVELQDVKVEPGDLEAGQWNRSRFY